MCKSSQCQCQDTFLEVNEKIVLSIIISIHKYIGKYSLNTQKHFNYQYHDIKLKTINNIDNIIIVVQL